MRDWDVEVRYQCFFLILPSLVNYYSTNRSLDLTSQVDIC